MIMNISSLRVLVRRSPWKFPLGFSPNSCFSTWKSNCFLSTDSEKAVKNNNNNNNSGLPRDAAKSISNYFNNPMIDSAALKPSIRLTPMTMLYTGKSPDGYHLMRSAQYLQKEMPVRIAHRIDDFRELPFIVGCNPTIMKVHAMYVNAFQILTEFPKIRDVEDKKRYNVLLANLLDDFKDVISLLAVGFRECRRHIKEENLIKNFLNQTLTSRLGIRMLGEHHLALHEDMPNYVGIIHTHMPVAKLIMKWADYAAKLCCHNYGVAPSVKLIGHTNVTFPYITQPLDYILPELIKNAFRATVENNLNNLNNLPEVVVTVVSNETEFIVKISDYGGGIPSHLTDKVFQYNFSTSGSGDNNSQFGSVMSQMTDTTLSPMHGFGFGLPASKAYAMYLGGTLELQSLYGVGCDVYLRLKHFDNTSDSLRI